jgi:hypothetical protein
MRIAKVVLGVLLCAGSLSAQIGPHSTARGSGEPFTLLQEAPCLNAALASDAVFLRLSELPGIATARTLEIAIERGGELLASERFPLGADKQGDVEILARQPELLARVHRAVEKDGQRVRLSVRLDGVEVRGLSFNEAVTASRGIKQNGLAPVILPSLLAGGARPAVSPRSASAVLPRSITKGSTPDQACVDACYDQWGYCGSVEQVGCDCYPHCIDQCIDSCPTTCTDPVSVSDRTEVSIVGATLVEYACYEDWFESDFESGHYYRTYQITYKHTTIRTTRYCDGSTTEEVTGVSYSTGYCSIRDQFTTCQYPNFYPWAGSC